MQGSVILSRVAEADGGVALTQAVSLTEAKRHLNIFHAEDDALITALIVAAQASIEGIDGTGGTLGRAITRHTLDMVCEDFPDASRLALPQPPLVSVASVKYLDTTGTERTFAASGYHVVADKYVPHVRLKDGVSWPSLADAPDAIRVRYVVGPAECPGDIKQAILLHVAHLYANREAAGENLTPLPMAYKYLLDPHRTHGWM
jgi:uncharacterized phiE125 gp8 family phage protein